ncbi:MAG: hypothetical protein IJ048_08280 [Clostridia bacterium]|nr:hypothetical protein [Clostridia bacterium]
MSKAKRLTALLLCVCMALVLLISSAYIVREADHDCVGEGCHTCETIERMAAAIRGFGMALLVLLAAFFLLALRPVRRFSEGERLPVCGTLVSWKIRLNN